MPLNCFQDLFSSSSFLGHAPLNLQLQRNSCLQTIEAHGAVDSSLPLAKQEVLSQN
jgi:hypothetical protein